MIESGMAAVPDLKRLAVGDRVQTPLLVVEVQHRDSARGGFTTLTLGNRHGQLSTAPFWPEGHPRLAGIERGAVAHVIGEVGLYNGKRHLKVSSIRALLRGAVDWRRLLPSVGDVVLGYPRSLAERAPGPAAPAYARPVLRRQRFSRPLRAVPWQHDRAPCRAGRAAAA